MLELSTNAKLNILNKWDLVMSKHLFNWAGVFLCLFFKLFRSSRAFTITDFEIILIL